MKRAESWGNDQGVPIAGGATWSTYTVDPASGLLYVSGGNPAPDFVPHLRKGANLYANSVVVLDAKTGAYRTHYSLVPHDFHDWDVAAAPVLVETKVAGSACSSRPRTVISMGTILHRASGCFARTSRRSRTPKPRWTTKLDGALGGGIITYSDGKRQRVAVTYGMQSPIWPAPKTTAKIAVFGL